ncbi:hypothetical protein BHE74_00050716 [Ensete ventricosum]|nr:hypothetical protein BHE74_00050716 [Ensete ventricosum]
MGQISDEVWKVIKSCENDIRGTVESVYDRIVKPEVNKQDSASPQRRLPVGDEKDQASLVAPSTCETNVSDGNEQMEVPPGFCSTDQPSSKVEHAVMLHDEQPHSSNEVLNDPEQIDAVPPGFGPPVNSSIIPVGVSDEDPDVPPGGSRAGFGELLLWFDGVCVVGQYIAQFPSFLGGIQQPKYGLQGRQLLWGSNVFEFAEGLLQLCKKIPDKLFAGNGGKRESSIPRQWVGLWDPHTVDAAATGGGVGGGVADVAFLSGRCLRFLRPQGYHHRWAEEDSNVRFHSLPQEHPGGKASNAVGNVAFLKAKDGGLDVIQTYVFWNGHEPSPGQVRRSPNLSQPSRLRLLLLPTVYLNLLLFLIFGSIILVIENEYGPVEYYGGAAAKNYVTWAARMAVGLNTGVPWVMCKQDDAPDPVVSPSFRFSCSVPPGRTPSSCSFSTFVQFNITLLLLYIPAAPIRVFVYACYTS